MSLFGQTLIERRAIGLNEPERKRVLEWIADLEHDMRTLDAKCRAVEADANLSAAGKTRALATLREEAASRFEELQAQTAALTQELKEVEENALYLEPNPEAPGTFSRRKPHEHTALQELEDRETRDILYTKDQHERNATFLDRIRKHGVDDPIVRAIERASELAPLVSAETRAKGREIAIEASPVADVVRSRRGELAIHEQLAFKATEVLKELGVAVSQPRQLILGSEVEAQR